MLRNLYQLLAVMGFVLISNALIGQVTTSSLSGTVKDQSGNALLGATVKAIHQPTGTVFNSKTTTGGRYYIGNVPSGGPYELTVSFVGFTTQRLGEIQLSLGETGKFDFQLNTTAEELKGNVVVTATRKQQAIAKGGG